MVEFALLAPLAFLVMLGALDFGRLTYDNSFMNNAAREGARVVTPLNMSGASPSTIRDAIVAAVKRTTGGGIQVDSSQLYDLTTIGGSSTTAGTCPTTRPAPNDVRIYIAPYPTTSTPIPTGQQDVTVQICFYFAPWVPEVAKWFPGSFVMRASSTQLTEY